MSEQNIIIEEIKDEATEDTYTSSADALEATDSYESENEITTEDAVTEISVTIEEAVPESENQPEEDPHRTSHKAFIRELKKMKHSYVYIVLSVAIFILAGVCVAIVSKVIYGIITVVASAITYNIILKVLMRKRFGIAYKSDAGVMTITKVYGKGRPEFWLPSRVIWLDVTSIDDHAFCAKSCKEIHTLHIPASVKYIGENVFCRCKHLKTIYFEGSREEFMQIDSHTDFSAYGMIFDDTMRYSLRKRKKKKSKKASAEENK